MHFEILVEDASGKIALEPIMEKIVGPNDLYHSWRIINYSGIGHIPKNLNLKTAPKKRLLLNSLPKVLRGYGKSLTPGYTAVVVVVDLDNKDCFAFKRDLLALLNACDPKPETLFRIAIEEMEAWFFGDHNAIKLAFPKAKNHVLNSYVQDSICGTWEKLAEAIYPGGAKKLTQQGYPLIGKEKCKWAQKIAPHLDVENNQSKTFRVFMRGVKRLADINT